MFKKTFLLLSIFILFYGCKSNKEKTENSLNIENFVDKKDILDNEKENSEYTIKTILGDSYYESSKEIYYPDMDKLKSLVNVFSQDELSELIEEIRIDFYILGIDETDLMFLEYFPHLKRLKLIGGKNVNIEGLKYLHNLEGLELVNMIVFDISPIANLVSLKILTLYDLLEIKDISPIASLKSLERLSLIGLESVNDISAISNLKNLEYLKISYNDISDSIDYLNPIFEITNLKMLELPIERKKIDIKNIIKLKNLEYLSININSQAEINIISDLLNLKELVIWFGNFNDVTPLLRLNKLEDIDFPIGLYLDIMPLAASKSLKHIRIGHNPEEWYEFMNNGYKLFVENDINISIYDWR